MTSGVHDQLKTQLARYPDLHYRIDDESITIDAPHPGGFEVSLLDDDGSWIVFFDSWHEHFDSLDEALECCEFGLSDRCRLEVTYHGNTPHRWTLQHETHAGWGEESTTGLFFFPFWRRKRIEYLSNSLQAAS